ncbi:MAG: capsid protein [Rhizobiaceae bacterium]
MRNRRGSFRHIVASTPSVRTLHAEMLRLCARIGYSPPATR